MSIKANFFKIGIFVIFTCTLLLVGVVFWGAQTFNQKKYYAETYTEESVQGLTVGSQVFTRGVQIGEVSEIAFVSAIYDVPEGTEAWETFAGYVYIKMSLNYERILNRADPNEFVERLVERGFRLRLSANPLTGIAFLEADFLDPNDYPLLSLPWEPTYAYIPTEASVISEFVSGAEKAMKRLDALDIEGLLEGAKKTLSQVDQAIQDVRVSVLSKEVETLVSHADTAVVNVNSMLRSTGTRKAPTTAEDILNSANGTLEGISNAVSEADVKAISEYAKALLSELRDSNQKLQSILRSTDSAKPPAAIDEVLAKLNEALSQVTLLIRQVEPGIQSIVDNAVGTSENLKQSTDDIKQQPSKLLFSQPPAHSEVMQ